MFATWSAQAAVSGPLVPPVGNSDLDEDRLGGGAVASPVHTQGDGWVMSLEESKERARAGCWCGCVVV